MGSNLTSKSGWAYNLFYKIGAGGTYIELNTSGIDISLPAWTYSFDVGTVSAIYLRFRAISPDPSIYESVSVEIRAVSYNKTKSARVSNHANGLSSNSNTRKNIPNL